MEENDKTLMTPQDLESAQPIADSIIEIIKDARPPAAVAGIALALAASAHLAQCGPGAAKQLFDYYFRRLAEMDSSPDRND